METRKVQRLGPSTLAMTLPAEWVSAQAVEKGDHVSLREGETGTLTVLPESARTGEVEATVHAAELDADALERAIVGQYVLGRRVIRVEAGEGALSSDHINAVYRAETQLMGLGVVEETPNDIAIRCSVDPADFTLDNLLERLESTGRTMRDEAVRALGTGDPDLSERALNRERQANKIFVLLLRLIFTAHRDPSVAGELGIDTGVPLVGYRSVAKNLELAADNAEDIAEIALETEGHKLNVGDGTMHAITKFSDRVDDIMADSVEAVVERDYDLTVVVREEFQEIADREREVLADVGDLPGEDLLEARDVLVALQQTAGYAVRNAEIAANLALDEESEYVTVE
jgi:phosphate uptake regulator